MKILKLMKKREIMIHEIIFVWWLNLNKKNLKLNIFLFDYYNKLFEQPAKIKQELEVESEKIQMK